MNFIRFSAPFACVLMVMVGARSLSGQVNLSITVGPPPIPEYDQPVLPGDGYSWIPGYWAWEGDGYFWVPGTWVETPAVGLLWTPGYWDWNGQYFIFRTGYWASHVGFYGGINYGYGYGGSGFEGAHWQGQHYYYNRAVTNVNRSHVTNVYNKTVVVHNPTRVAYNGGRGGLRAVPTSRDRTVEREHHVPPTAEQTQHHQSAGQNKGLFAVANHGRPPVAATARAKDFSPQSAVPARGPRGPEQNATRNAPGRAVTPAAKAHGADAKPAVPGRPGPRLERPPIAVAPPSAKVPASPPRRPVPQRRPDAPTSGRDPVPPKRIDPPPPPRPDLPHPPRVVQPEPAPIHLPPANRPQPAPARPEPPPQARPAPNPAPRREGEERPRQ